MMITCNVVGYHSFKYSLQHLPLGQLKNSYNCHKFLTVLSTMASPEFYLHECNRIVITQAIEYLISQD